MTTYYLRISNFISRHSTQNLRPQVFMSDRNTLIRAAADELMRQGGSLEEMAGIRFMEGDDGRFRPERELTPEETWEFSVEKLGDDGRIFEPFPDTEEGCAQFLAAAIEHGLREEAETLLNMLK